MFVFPVCVSCGMPVGHVAEVFAEMYGARVREHCKKNAVRADRVENDPNFKVTAPDLFEKLKIRKDCCRTRLLTSMDSRNAF